MNIKSANSKFLQRVKTVVDVPSDPFIGGICWIFRKREKKNENKKVIEKVRVFGKKKLKKRNSLADGEFDFDFR